MSEMSAEELENAIMRIRNHWDEEDFTLPREARIKYATSIADAYDLEAEIPEDQRQSYSVYLYQVLRKDNGGERLSLWQYTHATAEQRCRAWLKWKEASDE